MNKPLIVVFLIAITLTTIFALSVANAAATTPTVGVDSATQQFPSAQVGDLIQVNITVSNVQDLWSWSMVNLTYNPRILNITRATEGPFLQRAGQTEFVWPYNPAGVSMGLIPEIDNILLEQASESGSGVLVTLTFQVISLGTSPLSFGQMVMYNSSQIANIENPIAMNVNAVNANIVVGSSSNPTASASSTNPTQTPSNLAPEFPLTVMLALLIIAVTATTLFIVRNNRHGKKTSNFTFFVNTANFSAIMSALRNLSI